MHPRAATPALDASGAQRAHALLAFVRERGAVHPREVDAHFSHGTVTNYWGGSSSATTHLLDDMHYRGLLRVARRDARHPHLRRARARRLDLRTQRRASALDALVDVVVGKYAPLPGREPVGLVSRLRYARAAVARRAEARALPRAQSSGSRTRAWTASTGIGRPTSDRRRARNRPMTRAPAGAVRSGRLGSPPLRAVLGLAVPLRGLHAGAKRKLGYYALPLLWRDRVIGWGTSRSRTGSSWSVFGYVSSQPRERSFRSELEAEIERMRRFLGLGSG